MRSLVQTVVESGGVAIAVVGVVGTVVRVLVGYYQEQRARRRTQRVDEQIKLIARSFEPDSGGHEVEAVKAAVMESEAARQAGTALAGQRLERFVTDESVLREQAESKILEFLPSMPRNAKRLINHLRLLLVVASERKMLGGTPPLEPAHLGKWIVLLERWPELGSAVRADPAAMARLEQAAYGPAEALPDIVTMTAPQVVASSDLTTFLKNEPRM